MKRSGVQARKIKQVKTVRQGEEPEFYESDSHYYLWSVRLKATPGRIALLEALQGEPHPISVDDLQKKLSKKLNRVSVYRALEDLVEASLVRRIDISKDHALYEMSVGRKHHHHAVCTSCGHIEDISGCHTQELMKEARRGAKGFSRIEDHSLEFFGICKKCEVVK